MFLKIQNLKKHSVIFCQKILRLQRKMKSFSSFAILLTLANTTTSVIGVKPCYHGGGGMCYDPTVTEASNCYIDGTSTKVKMCCPPNMYQGCFNGELVSCDGDGVAMTIAITCGADSSDSSDEDDWFDVVEDVVDATMDVVEDMINP